MKTARVLALVGACVVVGGGIVAALRPAARRAVVAAPDAVRLWEGFFETDDGALTRLGGWDVRLAPDGTATYAAPGATLSVLSQLGPATSPLRLEGPGGSAQLQRGDVLERWRVRGQTLEQEWELSRAPAGEGPFEVALRWSGATVEQQDAQGTVWRAGEARLRYGHATWVDAKGTRTAIQGEVRGDVLAFRVPRELLRSSTYPAVLDPVVAPEQPVSVDPGGFGVAYGQTNPSVAMIEAQNTLVVWADARRTGAFGTQQSDIYGALVDVSGSSGLVVKSRFVIDGSSASLKTDPEVAAGVNEYLVVWTSTTAGNGDIRAAVVPKAGPTSRPASFAVHATPSSEITPAVAYSPIEQKYLVVFDSNANAGPIQARRVDLAGATPVIGSLFQPGGSPNAQTRPRVAWASSLRYVVVWANSLPASDTSIWFSKVAQDATSASASAQIASAIAGNKDYPDVISGPSAHLILWVDARTAGTVALYGTLVNSAGNLTSANGVLLRGIASSTVREPKGAYFQSGLTTYVLFFPEFDTGGWHFTSGWYNPTDLTPYGGNGYYQSLTVGNTNHAGVGIAASANFKGLAAYSDGVDLYLVPIHNVASLQVANTTSIAGAPSQDEARVGTVGGQVVVAWPQYNGEDGGTDFNFRRYRWDGGTLDPQPALIAKKPTFPSSLHFTSGKNESMALYSATPSIRPDVFAVPVLLDGGTGAPITVANTSSGEIASGLTFDGTNYFALWHVLTLTGSHHNAVAGKSVSPAGVLGTPVVVHNRGLAVTDSIRYTPAIATDAGILVAVEYTGVPPAAIYRTLVGSGDTTGGLVVTDAGFPSITVGGNGENLLVWEDYRGATAPDIYGQRLTNTGAFIDPSPVAIEVGASHAERPNVTFNGWQYLVSWQERQTDGGYDLHGRWLSPTLQPLNEYRVSTADDDVLPRTVSDGLGNSWVGFTRFKDRDDLSVSRVNSTIVSTGYLGEPCTTAAQCQLGLCVGGVCCDTACTGACQTCLQAQGATANGRCGPRTAGSICRTADAGCDAPERCDGTATTCPADGVEPATTLCRVPAGDCDRPELCTGSVKACPADQLMDAGVVCQDSSLLCALAATCSGTSVTCPAAGIRPPDSTCRPSAGDCDVEEKCDGVQQTCPPDGFAASSVVCRQSAGECDVADRCSGNAAACPPDQLAPSTLLCRESLGTCDVGEYCSGTSASCPANAYASVTTVCAEADPANECDEPDTCAGDMPVCGGNAKKPNGALCSQGAGVCQDGACMQLERSRYGWGCQGCASSGSGGGTAVLFVALTGWALSRRRRRALPSRGGSWHGLLLLAVVLVLPGRANAAGKLKLVFTGVIPGTGVSQETTQSVAEYVQTELTRIDTYSVVSQGDLQAMLGLERQKQLVGCGETSTCMAELTGALDADRLLRGEMSRLDDTIVLNFALIDARKSKPVGRSSRTIETGGVSAALREVAPMLYELLNQAPEHQDAPLVMDRGFGGIVVGLRADTDVLARGVAPALTAELSGRYIGGALTVLATVTPGIRLEVRGYPLTFKAVRPYLAAGTTIFSTGFGLRGAAGAAVRVSRVQISVDAAYERYLASFRPGYSNNAVVLGVGVGWQF